MEVLVGRRKSEGRAGEEGAQERVATAQATRGPVGDLMDVRDVDGGEVGQRMRFTWPQGSWTGFMCGA